MIKQLNSRVHPSLRIRAAVAMLSLTAPLPAQSQSLEGGLSGRVKNLSDGALPEYDANNEVKAGYFRIRVSPVGLPSATICPKTVFDNLPSDDRKRWKRAGGKIVDIVFKRNHTWGINATVILKPDSTLDARTAEVTLALIAIKDPKSSSCEIKVGGSTSSTVSYESFLVPLGASPANFNDRIQVNLSSSYTSVTDKGRMNLLWDGLLKPVVGAIFLPAVSVVGAVSDEAQPEIIKEMNKNVIASYPVTFNADPGSVQRAEKIFLKLDFINLPDTSGTPDTATGGVTIALEYQASVYLKGVSFYREITQTPIEILATKIRTATGDWTIASQLNPASYNALQTVAKTTDSFETGCATIRSELASKGLSNVDVAVFVWALASTNGSDEVHNKVWEIPCIQASRKDLAKVGIKPPPAPPPTPAGRLAILGEMHRAMDNLATLMQLGRAGPEFADLSQRFAPTITLIVDEHMRGILGLEDLVVTRDRDNILQMLASRFLRLGCYGPRSSSPDLILPMRPDFPPPLGAIERAGAAIALLGGRDGVTPEPQIMSFRFGPVAGIDPARITTISIAQRGADSGPVIRELTEGRRPKSCTENWMDPVFAK